MVQLRSPAGGPPAAPRQAAQLVKSSDHPTALPWQCPRRRRAGTRLPWHCRRGIAASESRRGDDHASLSSESGMMTRILPLLRRRLRAWVSSGPVAGPAADSERRQRPGRQQWWYIAPSFSPFSLEQRPVMPLFPWGIRLLFAALRFRLQHVVGKQLAAHPYFASMLACGILASRSLFAEMIHLWSVSISCLFSGLHARQYSRVYAFEQGSRNYSSPNFRSSEEPGQYETQVVLREKEHLSYAVS